MSFHPRSMSAFQIATSSAVNLVEISLFGININKVHKFKVAEETLFLSHLSAATI